MTEPELADATEVHDFVRVMRTHLADLAPREQADLTMGLEVDLAELVAERGAEALGDPAAYAAELRAAAGLPPAAPAAPGAPAARSPRATLMDAIDTAHGTWDRVLDALPGDLRGILTALQPVWWVARGAVAWLVLQDIRHPWIVLDVPWLVVLGVFLLVSVQLGRGAWRLGELRRTSLIARAALVGLNVFAVTMVPGAVDRVAWHVAEQRAHHFSEVSRPNPGVIEYGGRQVCDLQVIDRQGRRIPGATVLDATGGRPLPMSNPNC